MMPVAEPEGEVMPRDELAGMEVTGIPGRVHVLSGTKNSVQVVVRINTPAPDNAEETVRPPLHVACVMDCSYSMRGQKLEFAKKAVCKLVKHLSPGDTLHFITYDTDARVVFENGDLSETGKARLRHQIESVRVAGQTNLCGGLDLAASLLGGTVESPLERRSLFSKLSFQGKSSARPKDDGVIRRIFLFSDGRVNVGVTDPQAIRHKVESWAQAGITTCSFGIGADFDEPLMRGIAASGQGRYQFLATAQDIPTLVSKSVHDLIDIFASDAILDIRGFEHTTVARVHGGHDEDGSANGAAGAAGLLYLGDIHSDSLRVVLAELEVAPPGNADQAYAFDAAEWVLTCKRKGAPVQLSGRVQLRPTRDRALLGDNAAAVQVAFAVRQAADLEREVADHLSSRNRQRARELKSTQIALLEEALQAGRREEGSLGRELELLTVVLERARVIAERLEDDDEDEELMARQCWQDRDDFSAASICDLAQRENSSASGDDVANLSDLDFTPQGSPRSAQSPRDLGFTPQGSPRSPQSPRSDSSHSSPCTTQSTAATTGTPPEFRDRVGNNIQCGETLTTRLRRLSQSANPFRKRRSAQ